MSFEDADFDEALPFDDEPVALAVLPLFPDVEVLLALEVPFGLGAPTFAFGEVPFAALLPEPLPEVAPVAVVMPLLDEPLLLVVLLFVVLLFVVLLELLLELAPDGVIEPDGIAVCCFRWAVCCWAFCC